MPTDVRTSPSGPVVSVSGGGGSPTGPAGGNLGGTYPNPTVVGLTSTDPATLNITTIPDGTYLQRVGGNIVGTTPGGGGAPAGPAGGDLGGTYPNPNVIALHESGATRLPIGAVGSDNTLLSRVAGAIVGLAISAPLLFGATLDISTVSNLARGVAPAITAANAVPLSNGGGTAAVWTALSGGGSPVGTSRAINTTAPLAGGGSLAADLTLSVTPVSNATAGVVPPVPGTVGLALTSTATASAWGVDFGANNPTTTGGWISNAGAGFFRVGLAPGSGAGSSAAAGSIRLPNGAFVGIINGRNAADNADVFLFGWSSSALDIQAGTNGAGGNNTFTASGLTAFRVRLTTSATVVMQCTTTALTFSGINAVNFDGVPTVTISQAVAAGAGKALSVIAQAGSTTGGNLNLGGGDAAAANAAGSVQLIPGKGSGLAGNINLGKATTPIWNNLQRGMFVSDAEAVANAAPIGGSYVYGFSGSGTARSPNNTYSALWTNSATNATVGVIAYVPKIDSKGFAAGAVGTVVSLDVSAPGAGLPAINNASIRVTANITGFSSANEYARLDFVADFKVVAGVLTQLGTSTLTYSFLEGAMSTLVANLVVSGTSIVLQTTVGGSTNNLTGTITYNTSSF